MTRQKHQEKAITWQSYVYMQVCLENLQSGKFPNGKLMTSKDIADTNKHIANCTEVLKEYGCELPNITESIVTQPIKPQLTLF